MSIEVVPTCVPESLEGFIEATERFAPFAPAVHLDVDDGVFAPHTTWPFGEGQYEELIAASERGSLGEISVPWDVHIMGVSPGESGALFARCGARHVTGHIEAFDSEDDVRSALDAWREAGAAPGLAVLLDTPEEVITPYLEAVDYIQLMTIATIGKQGAPFEARAIERVARIHALKPTLPIAVDGGVGMSNIADLARAGATIFSVGAAIARADDAFRAWQNLTDAAASA